jgi:hypothetical protein
LNGQSARNLTRAAAAVVVAAIVIAAAALSYSAIEATVTKTSTYTTTAVLPSSITVTSILNRTTTVMLYGNTKLVGNCTVTNYFVPDTVEAFPTNVTYTSEGSTYTYTTYYQVGPTTDTQVSTSYLTTVYANETGAFTFVSTSTGDYSPSAGWTVTVCAFDE